MSDGNITKEYFPDEFQTVAQCEDRGYVLANRYSDQITEKYPNLANFDIECRYEAQEI